MKVSVSDERVGGHARRQHVHGEICFWLCSRSAKIRPLLDNEPLTFPRWYIVINGAGQAERMKRNPDF